MSGRGDQHVWGIRANETVWACVCGVKRGKVNGVTMYYMPITGRWRLKRPDCPHYGKLYDGTAEGTEAPINPTPPPGTGDPR